MKILLVEDQKAFQMIFRDLLEHEGHEVSVADNGNQGWEFAVNIRPDLILLDLILPGVGGMEILKRIRENEITKGIAVIILSALEDFQVMQKCYHLGANNYFIKGAHSQSDLLTTIYATMEERWSPIQSVRPGTR